MRREGIERNLQKVMNIKMQKESRACAPLDFSFLLCKYTRFRNDMYI